jgi:hypothetical protein
MKARHLLIIGSLVSICLALDYATTAAQDIDIVGERLRVDLANARQVEGVVIDWTTQTLSVRTDRDSVWTSGWADIARVERLRTRRRTARGLGLGLIIGGLGTGVVTAIVLEPCDGTGFCIGPDSRTEGFVVGGLLGAALGGAVGLLVGTAVQTSSWELLAIPGRAASTSLGVRWRLPN